MKTLAEFLVDHIIDCDDFTPKEWQEFRSEYIRDYNKAIEAYKDHLRNDSPKTVHWAMIERDLIVALERMQSQDSLEGSMHNNQMHSNDCASHNSPPAGFASSVSDCDCKPNLKEVKHPICPLNMYFEGDEDKIDLDKCDFQNRGCSNTCNKNSNGDFKCHT
jgi:hypothetical protein